MSQPPPVKMPIGYRQVPEIARYEREQQNAIYQLWANRGNVDSNPPATASATGKKGNFTWDSGYLYICVATDTWKRAALSTW
jgi:hypothetical protein